MKVQDKRRNTVYAPHWQGIRIECLGQWTDKKGLHANLNILTAYLGYSQMDNRYTRSWRVLNLLNGTRMGFMGMGLKGTDLDIELVSFKQTISRQYLHFARKSNQRILTVDEARIRKEWVILEADKRKAILKDLSSRLSKHNTSKHREDLRQVVQILTELESTDGP